MHLWDRTSFFEIIVEVVDWVVAAPRHVLRLVHLFRPTDRSLGTGYAHDLQQRHPLLNVLHNGRTLGVVSLHVIQLFRPTINPPSKYRTVKNPSSCWKSKAGHDAADKGEPLISPARFSPITAGKRLLKPSSPRKITMRPVVKVGRVGMYATCWRQHEKAEP